MSTPKQRDPALALYDQARHEPLLVAEWSPGNVRQAIERIVYDLLARADKHYGWLPHPDDSDQPAAPLTPLYFGSTGLLWALRYLRRQGLGPELPGSLAADVDFDPLLQRHHAWLDAQGGNGHDSYFLGEVPLLLMAYAQAPEAVLAARLHTVLGQAHDPTLEILWGRPGLILATLFLYEHTGETGWADLFQLQTRRLWNALEADPDSGIRLWLQDLYGERSRLVGAMHGFAGNVFPVIKGLHLLPAREQAEWTELVVATTQATAQQIDGLLNWPQSLGTPRKGRDAWLIQHCHGAPGMVNSLAELADPRLDDLLALAGETIWQAGPLRKGSNLCHGTGGNGYALLKLYQRTGDALWLERARAFAMHGIGQTDTARRRHGQGHHSLWTGDAGFAIYLWDCLRGKPAIPTWDVFF